MQAAPEHHNIEELLAAGAPRVPGESDTVAALKDLDLGGKTQEEYEADQLKLKEQISASSQKLEEELDNEEEKKAEEEALPISKKDAALKSLVNFENLNKEVESEVMDEEPAEKPVYIDPSKTKK